MKKSDEQLRAEANALDAAYAGAEIFDLRNENQYLRRVLSNLLDHVGEDVEFKSKHLQTAIDDAMEALGYLDIE